MKLKKTSKINTTTATVLEEGQVLNISQARAMFSDIIKPPTTGLSLITFDKHFKLLGQKYGFKFYP